MGNKTELRLRPAARLVKILGEQLIRDNSTGVMELIKNGYDADAEKVIVGLHNLSNYHTTEVTIEDDGDGMDEETIRGPWSEPAHGRKYSAKMRSERTKKNRLPLGEKGVERFASQRLGRYLELVTKPRNSAFEYLLRIDWDDFDNSYSIDQVPLPFEKRVPETFAGDRHGTKLIIKCARTRWTRKDIERLQASIKRLLIPPVNHNFSVIFECPEFPELENLEQTDVLSLFQFKIDCSIDKYGIASYRYSSRKPDNSVVECQERINLWASVTADWQKIYPSCGPFNIVICAWLRTSDNLRKYNITREQLDSVCGLSIYRDGFRVIPYGDQGNDWLGMALRRVKTPGQKYDNNQIIGRIEISQDKNPDLTDKTNREGLLENQSYFDLKNLILGTLSILEKESLVERIGLKNHPENKRTLTKKIGNILKEIENLKSHAGMDRSGDHVNTGVHMYNNSENKDKPAVIEKSNVTQTFPEISDKQQVQAKDVPHDLFQELSGSNHEKRDMILHLINQGLVAERLASRLKKLTDDITVNLKGLKQLSSCDQNVIALNTISDTLENEMLMISTSSRVVAGKVMTSTTKVIERVMRSHLRELVDYSITLEKDLSPFEIAIPSAILLQVIDNIVANGIFWLTRKSEINGRNLSVYSNSEERSIYICNNGPSIQPQIKKTIFNSPFVTCRTKGHGLGMYISSEILKRYNCSVELEDEKSPANKYHSACFKISCHKLPSSCGLV